MIATASDPLMFRDGIKPPNDTVVNASVAPNQAVTITVHLQAATTVDQIVYVSMGSSNFFSSYPTSFFIPAGSSAGSCTAYVSSSASGTCLITTLTAGHTTSASTYVVTPLAARK